MIQAGRIGEIGNRASGFIQPQLFLTPVVDDDAPRSLQPFLQRAGVVYVTAGGGGFVTRYVGLERTASYLWTNAGIDAYVTPSFALIGSFQYGYDVLHDVGVANTTHGFSGSAGFGARVGDEEFDVVYTFATNEQNGRFLPVRWGAIDLSLYLVFGRRFSVQPWGRILDGGGGGGLAMSFYPTKDLGFSLRGSALTGRYTTELSASRFTGSPAISYWVSPVVRLELEYTLTVEELPEELFDGNFSQMEHALELALAVRL